MILTFTDKTDGSEIKIKVEKISGIKNIEGGAIICEDDGTEFTVKESKSEIEGMINKETRLMKDAQRKTKEHDGVVL